AATAGGTPALPVCSWQPTPFLPWHQPFFNESSHYRVRAKLPADQQIACTGSIVAARRLDDGRQQVDIVAPGVRDFAFLCSARYHVFEGVVDVPRPTPASSGGEDTLPAPRRVSHTPEKDGSPHNSSSQVRIRVIAFPEHEHYAREMVRIAQ